MSPTPPDKQDAGAPLLNGFMALETFSTLDRPLLGITEIVDRHKSTVSRMLTGLSD